MKEELKLCIDHKLELVKRGYASAEAMSVIAQTVHRSGCQICKRNELGLKLKRYDNPFMPWNDPSKDSPFKPWNSPQYEDDPQAPWNNPLSNDRDYQRYCDRKRINERDR